MTFAFNWGNCLNEVIRAHCCSPGPRGVMSIEITVCVFGGVFVFVHLLWATVILAEMSMRFFWACVCTCAIWDACVPECSVIMQSVMFLLSLWSWSVAMWCGWYICANVWVCVWSSLALVRLEANAVLNRYNSSFSRSFELPDSVDILRAEPQPIFARVSPFCSPQHSFLSFLLNSSLSAPF